MKSPMFTEVTQIGIVVCDLDATMHRYVHHIAVVTPDYDAALAAEAKRGNTLALSGTFSGIRIAYLPTDRTLGVLLEVFSGWPGAQKKSGARKKPGTRRKPRTR